MNKELPENFVYDLDGLKQFPGVIQVCDAGLFAGNISYAATYKQIDRITFPIKVSQKGDGMCCLKNNVEKYLRDGIPQPQEFLLSRKKFASPQGHMRAHTKQKTALNDAYNSISRYSKTENNKVSG
jgi:hypothetical protein